MLDHPRNRALWLGPLTAAFGVVSYFTIAYRWPPLRDLPWANLALLAVGALVSARALGRAWPRGGARRLLGVLGLTLSAGLGAFFVWFCFFASSELPGEDLALGVGTPTPKVLLQDHRGAPFDIAEDSRGPTILVFYRGHW